MLCLILVSITVFAETDIRIVLDKSIENINIGEKTTIKATTTPEGEKVTWVSSNEQVATVDDNGVVTGKKAGKTNIKAKVGEVESTYDCQIIVHNTQSTIKFTDLSNAKMEIPSFKTYSMASLNIEIKSYNKDSRYYGYMSHSKNDTPTREEYGVYAGKDEKGLSFSLNNEFLETKGDIYVWVMEECSDENNDVFSKVLISGKKVERPALPALGNRMDIWLYDESQTSFSNTIRFTETRKVTYKIGRITDTNILKSFKTEAESKAFSKLLDYAKKSQYIKTGEITTKGLNKNIIADQKIVNDAYYFVYMIADDENGKYETLEDVAIYKAYIDQNGAKTMCHFAFSEMEWEEETPEVPTDTGKKDDTILPGDLPATGKGIAIATGTVVLIALAVIGYKKNQTYKDIK